MNDTAIERLRADMAYWQGKKAELDAVQAVNDYIETDCALEESYAEGRIAALTDALLLFQGIEHKLYSETEQVQSSSMSQSSSCSTGGTT
jgi:hypothetical protein